MMVNYEIFMKIGFLFLGLMLSVSMNCLVAQDKSTIVFMGDSFTDGDGVEKSKTFASLVGEALKNVNTVNQGRSGWPTTAYLRRRDEVSKSLPVSADMFFIQLGANDLRVDGHSTETILQCKQNMQEIVARLKVQFPNAKIVLMSSVKIDETKLTKPIREAGFGKHSNKLLRQIGKEYKALAQQHGYGYIDLISKLPRHNNHDGAHLTEEGHKIVSNVIVKYLHKKGYR